MSSRPRYPAGTGRPVAGRRRGLRRDRRALIAAAIPVAAVAILALILSLGDGGTASDAAGPLATPVPPPSQSGSGAKPPDVVIARGEGVEVHLPVDSQRVTAAMFHPVNDTAGVALQATGSLEIHQADRGDRSGPETAGLDVGAPPGTTVYSPVDGVIAGVSDYVISGRIEGYEVVIAPSVAASGLVLRLTHLDEPVNAERPSVGTPVRAGTTPLGRVRDFSPVARQEISEFTSDSGNHLHMELVRTEGDLIP
jgi:murein DD-endopeptidase MepM/ murein hydrolase activator NlpD